VPRRAKVQPPLDIRDVQTIKHDRTFMISDPFGDVPAGNTAALGLYFRDTRFLSRWELLIDGGRPLRLHSEADRNYSMRVESTLPIERVDPTGMEKRENIAISRHRWLERGMRESIRVQNFSAKRRRVRLDVRFGSDFRDLFEVRGWARQKRGNMLDPEVGASRVQLGYEGIDGVKRTLELSFEPKPERIWKDRATFRMQLDPQSIAELQVQFRLRAGEHEPPDVELDGLEREYSRWRKHCTRFRVSNAQLQQYLDRAILDLRMLQTDMDGTPVLDAGVPWFSTLFGRDALITAYQSLALGPELAIGTLEKLAELQGSKVDPARDEEPGKIMHEIRVGELAGAGEVPHTPYYGSIDSTPLWLILYGYVWSWTGDRGVIERLWPAAERALEWIDRYGDEDGDGYVEYEKKSEGGLDNQGWKDSRDGILHADGSIPKAPIALCEVQGYVYQAKVRTARVARALGHEDLADELEKQAEELKRRFNEDFWMADEGYFAVALDGKKKQVRSITSNPGHCLWSRIVDPSKAQRVARTLLSSDLSSGWGIRTLSASNPSFDPIGYHTGSIWPHDNALIAHGLKLYGFDEEANKVIDQLALAGAFFRDSRFPELFCGFSRADVPVPVEYPVACRPQAWATGAPLLMMRSYGGMSADAPNQTLSIRQPSLPFWLEHFEMIGMRVGKTRLDLMFNSHQGASAVQVIRKEGDLEVLVRY
jgi:glycogen debranching enzyme